MPIKKQSGRQDPITAVVTGTFADVVDNTYMAAVDVPPGAIVIGGGLAITTLFDSVTTDQFSIGDQEGTDVASKTTYAALSADVTVAGTWIPIVPNGKKYTKKATVGIVWDGTGAAPANGAFRFIVNYIIDGRAHSSEG